VTDGVTVKPLSASLLQKIRVAVDHLCQITLNQKLLCKFENFCKFSNCIKANEHKMIPASTQREMSVEAWVHGIISESWALWFRKKKRKIQYKSLQNRVFICKPSIPALQFTAFITVNYKNNLSFCIHRVHRASHCGLNAFA
jgi:hypothetical protein